MYVCVCERNHLPSSLSDMQAIQCIVQNLWLISTFTTCGRVISLATLDVTLDYDNKACGVGIESKTPAELE